MSVKTTLNQRFVKFLEVKEMYQSAFCQITGLEKATVNNICTGNTKRPGSDFFEAIARHFPEWLFWLLLGEEKYYPKGEKLLVELRDDDVFQVAESKDKIIENLSGTIHQMTLMLSDFQRTKV